MRPKIKVHSAWEYVGGAVLKAWTGDREIKTCGNQVIAVMVAAINPKALAESVRNKKARELARVFGEFYAVEPDLTLRMLRVIREKWDSHSVTARVQKHLLTQAYHERPIVKDGKFQKGGKFHHDASLGELSYAVSPKETITLDAVKKARKRAHAPAWRPWISRELNAALQELRGQGFDVGLGC